ncbi:hypothetical protein [uncultured Zoogloea sp.]|uniref:hypothetical protein n=1 Tax=uncultured Zoogloea sp. TaxID=160237 RepID=UPI00261A14E1|nr:hypothetical protein [uncultured Zoogloea sp.]
MKNSISTNKIMERLGSSVEINPATGNLRIAVQFNDIYWAIDALGGSEKAALTLNVSPKVVERWTEDYYVPNRYAKIISSLTGYSLESLTIPVVVYEDRDSGEFWPITALIAIREREFLDEDDIIELMA